MSSVVSTNSTSVDLLGPFEERDASAHRIEYRRASVPRAPQFLASSLRPRCVQYLFSIPPKVFSMATSGGAHADGYRKVSGYFAVPC
jgi:hypothetical protein